MKNTYLLICFWMISSLAFGQYIGVQYPSEQEMDCSYYKIFDFNGNLVLQLKDKEMPFMSSHLLKQYQVEEKGWTASYKDRGISKNDYFFVTDDDQKVLAITTESQTYLLNFKGKKVKAFGGKYRFLSQPSNGILIGYRALEDYGTFMLTYINEDGEELFGGKEFWEATPFSEGHAIVQETKESDWKVIDLTGKEVTNLSSKFDLKIVEAHSFINGLANISVALEMEDVKAIVDRIKQDEVAQKKYFDVLANSGENESKISNVLYRVDSQGNAQELGENTSIINDIYYRKFYKGQDYNKAIHSKSSLNSMEVIDSVLSENGKYYLTNDGGKPKVVHQSGEPVAFPDRYTPVKCTEDLVLGKRRDKYVLFDPFTKTSLFFEDETPMHFGDLFVESSEPLEDFIVMHDRLLKIGPNGLSSLLNLKGELMYDFDATPADASITPEMKEMSEVFDCPDNEDFQELKTKFRKHLHINCSHVDLMKISSLPTLKTLVLSDVSSLSNTEVIGYMLQQKTTIAINGTISLEDLKVDVDKLSPESLYINEEDVKSLK